MLNAIRMTEVGVETFSLILENGGRFEKETFLVTDSFIFKTSQLLVPQVAAK